MNKVFVSYVAQMKSGNFYGDAVININFAIQNADDVDILRGKIKKDLRDRGYQFENVFIQNWIVMAQ